MPCSAGTHVSVEAVYQEMVHLYLYLAVESAGKHTADDFVGDVECVRLRYSKECPSQGLLSLLLEHTQRNSIFCARIWLVTENSVSRTQMNWEQLRWKEIHAWVLSPFVCPFISHQVTWISTVRHVMCSLEQTRTAEQCGFVLKAVTHTLALYFAHVKAYTEHRN